MTSDAVASWDVVVVPFPYSERLAEKRRPALVVSSNNLHSVGMIWLAMITGAAKAMRDGDIPIRDIAVAGLPGPSMVRTCKIATVEPNRILKVAGRIDADERKAIARAILRFLARV